MRCAEVKSLHLVRPITVLRPVIWKRKKENLSMLSWIMYYVYLQWLSSLHQWIQCKFDTSIPQWFCTTFLMHFGMLRTSFLDRRDDQEVSSNFCFKSLVENWSFLFSSLQKHQSDWGSGLLLGWSDDLTRFFLLWWPRYGLVHCGLALHNVKSADFIYTVKSR